MHIRTISDKEKHLHNKAQQFLPGGSLGNTPMDVILREGHGSRVWDISGNEMVDYLIGSGPMLVGHGHPEVLNTIRTQIELGTTFFTSNEHAILLAEELVDAVACAEKVRFVSTGSEATHYAMRAARAYRKRDVILKFEGGFHGMNDSALMSMSPSSSSEPPIARPDSAGIPRSVEKDMLIAPFNNLEQTADLIKKHQDKIGAVIVEPLQRIIPPLPGFLQGLREITTDLDIPLIFDEIVTGFRLAYGGAQEYYGVTPDICTLGKAIAGGFPLAAIAGKNHIMSNFDMDLSKDGSYLPQIGTLSGNPVAASAGLATLEILKRENTYQNLFKTGVELQKGLQQIIDRTEIAAQLVGAPPLFDIVFSDATITDYRSMLSNDKKMASRFNQLLLRRGVLKGDWKFYLSTVHTQEDLDWTFQAFEDSLSELLQ